MLISFLLLLMSENSVFGQMSSKVNTSANTTLYFCSVAVASYTFYDTFRIHLVASTRSRINALAFTFSMRQAVHGHSLPITFLESVTSLT